MAAVLELWTLRTAPASPTMLAAVAAGALFAASCLAGGRGVEAVRDPGGDLTAREVRACLDAWPPADGLIFRTTREHSESFVGVVMLDTTSLPQHMATVGIAVYSDADRLDAYEERAREDPDDEVRRVRNAVVSTHGHFSGRLALGAQRVRGCLR